jgi:hypothetical protein
MERYFFGESSMSEGAIRVVTPTLFDRGTFIGGSDARIIMGKDEAALIQLWHVIDRGVTCRFAALLQESLSVAHRSGAIDTKDLERVAIDTTVQEKALARPTDAWLTHARPRLGG